MKKINNIIIALCSYSAMAQFQIDIKTTGIPQGKEAYIYTLEGSKDILYAREKVTKNGIKLSYPSYYRGMMKIYLPEYKANIPFISENQAVELLIEAQDDKITQVKYQDEPNQLMNKLQTEGRRKDILLPVLQQLQQYYLETAEFGLALNKEIENLKGQEINTSSYPFLEFYRTNIEIFNKQSNKLTPENIIEFLKTANSMLENSGILHTAVMVYLNLPSSLQAPDNAIDTLLNAVDIETSRGQNILSEMIDIFHSYGAVDLRDKYVKLAETLQCSVNNNLSETIAKNNSIKIGATIQNTPLNNAINTKAKSIYDVKANKKVLIFWSSDCGHCNKELPRFIPVYEELKAKKIEVIALSLDSDKTHYIQKAEKYPWISASDLKGWNSEYASKYYVKGTPTYIVIDDKNKIIATPMHFEEVIEVLNK